MTSFVEILARAVIIKNGEILLNRHQGNDQWFFPGGHVEFSEAADTALNRELQEELGVNVTIHDYLGTAENFFTQEGQRHHEINLVFAASLDSEPEQPREQHLEFAWLPVKAMDETFILPDSLKVSIMQWIKDRQPFWASEGMEKGQSTSQKQMAEPTTVEEQAAPEEDKSAEEAEDK